jgi:GDP-L-fucose synthase
MPFAIEMVSENRIVLRKKCSVEKANKIYIAGHGGLVGSALLRKLEADGYTNLLVRTHQSLDLTNQAAVDAFFGEEQPDYVFLAAAKVGGILANSTFPAEFIYENLSIETNIIHSAWKSGVKRLLFLGSSCIYPRQCPQPIKEAYLLTGPLEPTNEAYAVAKIAGIKLCQAYNRQYGTRFFSVMPTNLYGPNDNFDLKTSHVLPALIRKFHTAKNQPKPRGKAPSVTIWGTGKPRREFLHADDLANACLFLMNLDEKSFQELTAGQDLPLVNIGWGKDIIIEELAHLIKEVVGFEGKIVFDPSLPDGTPQKLLDISKISELGWKARISLREGIGNTYQWCLKKNLF